MIKLIIPAIPPSLNDLLRMHRMARHRLNKKWAELIWVANRDNGKPMYQKANVTLTYYFSTNRRRDPDNYAGKLPLDGLRKAGVLADDSFNNVSTKPVAEYDPINPRTEITVEEAV